MTDEERMTLIHGELDGELTNQQRGDLARLVLADPQARAWRDQLKSLCSRLDAMGQVEPPSELRDSIVRRLPPAPVRARPPAYGQTSVRLWRLAAMVVGVLTAGTVVYETVQWPAPGSKDTAGTMATYVPTSLESVALGGVVTGSATLYRDKRGLAVGLDVSAAEPVDLVISTQGRSFVIKGLRGSDTANLRRTIALPGVSMQGQDIELSFVMGDRTVSRATLRAPSSP